MIEDAMNRDVAGQEVPRKKSIRRRLIVGSMLAIAALGAHRLVGQRVPVTDANEMLAKSEVTANVTTNMAGPNSLFGDVHIDREPEIPVTAHLGSDELDLSSLADQAGFASLTLPTLSGLDSNASTQLAVADAAATSSVAAVSAVPEPNVAGVALMALAPVLVLRRPHRGGK
jgi:hypothetical protein